MPHFGCPECLRVVNVRGAVVEIRDLLMNHPMWKDGRPCITESCAGSMDPMRIADVDSVRMAVDEIALTPQELFGALCGFGIPTEIASDPEVVKSLLISERIVDVKVRQWHARTVIDHIDLDNGLRMHLTLGSAGAVVFKITRYRDGATADVGNDQGGVRQDPEVDRLQRDDRVREGGQERGECLGDTSVGRVDPGSVDGGHHPETPQEAPDSPGGDRHDGAADGEDGAVPAG